jgi:glycosyltransferase involved in cell wall biosynthesis
MGPGRFGGQHSMQTECLTGLTMTHNALNILSVAYPLARVATDCVGGAEQVLAQLDANLTLAGHNSLVIASQGSCVAGTLIPTPAWNGALDGRARASAAKAQAQAISTTLKNYPVDVIHLHGFDFHRYLPACAKATLVTLHLPPEWYPAEIFQGDRKSTFFHCVSPNQKRACPPCSRMLPEIENGVSLERFGAKYAKRNFALALGRICPEKGFHTAIDAAKQACIPLLLAGKVYGYAEHEAYFNQQISPRLDDLRRFVGPVAGIRKQQLLSAAKCLLIASLAPETSSLVAMEALASGTPVIAFPAGALADIVEHGKTGFLVRDESEMAAAIGRCGQIDPENCRASARKRFDLNHMVERYLAVYRWLAGLEVETNGKHFERDVHTHCAGSPHVGGNGKPGAGMGGVVLEVS